MNKGLCNIGKLTITCSLVRKNKKEQNYKNVAENLKALSSEIDLAEIRFIQKAAIKE